MEGCVIDFVVGQKVAVFGPYDCEPCRVARVDKIHKTGHVVVESRRYRPFGDGCAFETGEGSRYSIRVLTPEVEAAANRAAKRRRMKEIAAWLEKAEPDHVPDDVLRAMIAACKASKTGLENGS